MTVNLALLYVARATAEEDDRPRVSLGPQIWATLSSQKMANLHGGRFFEATVDHLYQANLWANPRFEGYTVFALAELLGLSKWHPRKWSQLQNTGTANHYYLQGPESCGS